MNDKELFDSWKIPAIDRGGLALVPREFCIICLRKILAEKRLLGFDAFTLFADGKIQPHMEFSSNYSYALPSQVEIEKQINIAPSEVTHFEFVFE